MAKFIFKNYLIYKITNYGKSTLLYCGNISYSLGGKFSGLPCWWAYSYTFNNCGNCCITQVNTWTKTALN